MKHRAQNIIKEAEAEAEVLKKDKMLQAKEKFLQMKTEHEKQVAARNSKIQQAENKLKQQETEISRKLEDIQRKTKDIQSQQGNIDVQKELLEKKTAELDKLKKQQIEQLEAISGMSGEQAKEKLINSLKEEAEAEAISVKKIQMFTASPLYKRIMSSEQIFKEEAFTVAVKPLDIYGEEKYAGLEKLLYNKKNI